MAEGKKSFILYADLLSQVERMPPEKAGELFLTILQYVNDKDPEVDKLDWGVSSLFEGVKASLKRDLEKWEKQRKQRSEAGKRSAESRAAKKNEKQRALNNVQDRSTDSTVSVNVNDSVSVNAIEDSKESMSIEKARKIAKDWTLGTHPFKTDELNSMWFEWLVYKLARGEPMNKQVQYYAKQDLKSNKLCFVGGVFREKKAIEVIRESIAANSKNIHKPKEK